MDNLFKATKRESAVDIVVNSIKQLLADKKLLPGDKLPNELEISEGLGVSRGSVREAMKILSAFGLIDIRVGNGAIRPAASCWIPCCLHTSSPTPISQASMNSGVYLKPISYALRSTTMTKTRNSVIPCGKISRNWTH